MSMRVLPALLCCAALAVGTAACNKKADNTINFTSAINNYYDNHPACLWPTPRQMPAQTETSDHDKTMPFDALVDQGLLARTAAEKKKFIVASKRVNNYDLTDKGREAWTDDETQPGFGNFCYGHRKVSGIDSSTPTNDQPGASTQITYHYTFTGVPTWAQAQEIQNTYPQVHADISGLQTGTATLTNTDAGWQVTSVPNNANMPVTGADSKMVQ